MKKFIRVFMPIILLLVVAGSITAAGYFYYQYTKATAASREVQTLTEEVGKMIKLPEENPTLATVTEKEKLQDQPFFKDAENGDKVFIFANAKKAILYRPSSRMIIEVAPVQTNAAKSSGEVQGEQTKLKLTPSVAILNGSAVGGLSTSIENKLKTAFDEVNIISRVTAAKRDYARSVVVDTTGKYAQEAEAVAALLGNADVSSLPQGETAPSGAELVIVAAQ